MNYTEEVAIANRTSRGAGAVGARALVPRLVSGKYMLDTRILDYGAGKQAAHTRMLRDNGFVDVTAHDFGSNFDADIHDSDALAYRVHSFQRDKECLLTLR